MNEDNDVIICSTCGDRLWVDICPECSGDGTDGNGEAWCAECNGKGEVLACHCYWEARSRWEPA